MTTNASFDDRLSAWLRESAEHRVSDHLGEVLLATVATRQRRWWSSPERWLPMDLTSRATTLALPRFGRLLLVALLILAIATLAILAIGSTRPDVPPPFGPARNGTITFAASGDIYRSDSVDATPRLIVAAATVDGSPAFSRDGTRLMFLRDTHETGRGVALMVANADGSSVRQLLDLDEPPSAADSTPDGSLIAFAGDHGRGVYLLRTDSSTSPEQLELGAKDIRWLMWRPPDAHELLYLDGDAGRLQLSGVKPDGTGARLVMDLGFVDPVSMGQLDPSLSADGRYMVYASVDDGTFRNHLVDLQTGVNRALSLGPVGGHELHGILSPDGRKLLFHYADGESEAIQEMLAPIDGSSAAIPVGPRYPVINGSAELNQAFSPDGQTILIHQGRDRAVRFVDAVTGGTGRAPTWESPDLPAWQRLAP
jgi:hypothetical protein